MRVSHPAAIPSKGETVKIVSAAAITVVLGVASFGALAQAKPDVLVKQRQAVMTLQGKYIGPIAGMATGKVPYNADAVARNATYLENLVQMSWDGFHDSTKGEKNTRALPKIYSEKAKFDDYAQRLQAETAKLAQAARARDEAGVKKQFPAVLNTCNGCHDDFRSK
jgi:cytochrome c556